MSAADPGETTGSAPPAATRSYPVPFREVWEEVLKSASSLRGWEVLEQNSTRGTMRLNTRSLLGYRPVEAKLSLRLDELGQTRLEMTFLERRRLLLPAAGPTRARRMLNRLDRALQARRRP